MTESERDRENRQLMVAYIHEDSRVKDALLKGSFRPFVATADFASKTPSSPQSPLTNKELRSLPTPVESRGPELPWMLGGTTREPMWSHHHPLNDSEKNKTTHPPTPPQSVSPPSPSIENVKEVKEVKEAKAPASPPPSVAPSTRASPVAPQPQPPRQLKPQPPSKHNVASNVSVNTTPRHHQHPPNGNFAPQSFYYAPPPPPQFNPQYPQFQQPLHPQYPQQQQLAPQAYFYPPPPQQGHFPVYDLQQQQFQQQFQFQQRRY